MTKSSGDERPGAGRPGRPRLRERRRSERRPRRTLRGRRASTAAGTRRPFSFAALSSCKLWQA
eukprot:4299275-Alexandrium_andersonii.AAC.1